jgi:hypothetical protein
LTETGKTREGYAVELYFDSASEKTYFNFREDMYQNTGITPVLGNMNDRPHISLAVFGCIDPDPLIDLCRDYFAKSYGFPFQLGAVGTFFGKENVLYLTPVPSIELLNLHKDFHVRLKDKRIHSSEYYLPGSWIPHCTVEFEIPDDHFSKAILYARQHFTPIYGSLSLAGVVGFRPVEYLAEFILKGNVVD